MNSTFWDGSKHAVVKESVFEAIENKGGVTIKAKVQNTNEQLEFNFEYNVPVNSAKVNVTYKVTDTSGNTATCTGQIRFYSDKELIVGVNGFIIALVL